MLGHIISVGLVLRETATHNSTHISKLYILTNLDVDLQMVCSLNGASFRLLLILVSI